MERERALIEEFAALVKASIEPVVRPAGFEWNSSGLGYHRDQDELSALFEAEPITFARVMPSLGAHFPNGWPCIDLWIRFYVGLLNIEASLEGRDVAEWLREKGHVSLAETLNRPTDLHLAIRSLSAGLKVMLSTEA
jgi:hypothetical protein